MSELLSHLAEKNGTIGGSTPLPQGNQMPPVEEEAPEIEAAPEETPEEVPAEAFEVDGQRFASEKDALDYLSQRYSQKEQDNLLLEARLEGMQQALSTPGIAPPAPTQEMKDDLNFDEERYYENPAQYIAEYTRKVMETTNKQWDQKMSAQQQDAEAWNQFTAKFPELAQFRGDVMEMYNAHRDVALTLARKSPEKAMEFIAMKTKEKFQRYVDAMRPTKVLSNTKQGPSVGSNTSVTPKANPQGQAKKVDFTSQLRSMRGK